MKMISAFKNLCQNNVIAGSACVFVLLAIICITVSIQGLPLWGYILGIFGPMGIWAWLKPHKALDDLGILGDED
jgi:hypothetical protein